MKDFYSLSGREIVLFADIVAFALAENKNVKQLITLGNFIVIIGSTILTIASIDVDKLNEEEASLDAKITSAARRRARR